MTPEYLRGVLNGLHEQGLDLDTLTLGVKSASTDTVLVQTGTIHIEVSEDGKSGRLMLEVE
jgi:hypothetical protein